MVTERLDVGFVPAECPGANATGATHTSTLLIERLSEHHDLTVYVASQMDASDRDLPAQMEAFQIATEQDSDFSVKLEGSEQAFTHAENAPGFESVRYLEATTTNFKSSEFENATFTFRVSKAALASMEASRSDVSLYRYSAGSGAYERLSTEFVRETTTAYVYAAETTSFSEFSVGVEYDDSGTVRGLIESADVEFDADYDADVSFEIRAPIEQAAALRDRIRSATSGRARIDY